MSEAEEEHREVENLFKREEAGSRARCATGAPRGGRPRGHWGTIVAQAVQQVLSSCGDRTLEASTFSLPEKLSLREAAENSRSAVWLAILVSAVHVSLDAGCTILARDLRRALRQRLARLKPLSSVHDERADSLVATLHINWGAMLLASTGRPIKQLKASVRLRTLERRIERVEEDRIYALPQKARARLRA